MQIQKRSKKDMKSIFNPSFILIFTVLLPFFLLIFTVYWIYIGPKAHRGPDGKGHEEHFARLSWQKGANSVLREFLRAPYTEQA